MMTTMRVTVIWVTVQMIRSAIKYQSSVDAVHNRQVQTVPQIVWIENSLFVLMMIPAQGKCSNDIFDWIIQIISLFFQIKSFIHNQFICSIRRWCNKWRQFIAITIKEKSHFRTFLSQKGTKSFLNRISTKTYYKAYVMQNCIYQMLARIYIFNFYQLLN